jgi:general secretion pathway protein G
MVNIPIERLPAENKKTGYPGQCRPSLNFYTDIPILSARPDAHRGQLPIRKKVRQALAIKIFRYDEPAQRPLAGHTGEKGQHPAPWANRFGFTLVEVMICVCIVGVLSAIATPIYSGYRERARMSVTITDMRTIEDKIFIFAADNAALPDTLAQIGMDKVLDPWGRPFAYLRIDGGDVKGKGKLRKDHFMVPVNSDFDLYSLGRDGKSASPFTAKASRDDIVRAYDGGYFGKVSDL